MGYDKHYYICSRCDCEWNVDAEVQCTFCAAHFCVECDLEHFCAHSNTCTCCEKRFASADLTLVSCACDEELCKACLGAHRCPPTAGDALDAMTNDLAERMVGGLR
jgi:hypothetical protein